MTTSSFFLTCVLDLCSPLKKKVKEGPLFFFVSSFFHHGLFGRYFICSFVKTCPITTNKQKKSGFRVCECSGCWRCLFLQSCEQRKFVSLFPVFFFLVAVRIVLRSRREHSFSGIECR